MSKKVFITRPDSPSPNPGLPPEKENQPCSLSSNLHWHTHIDTIGEVKMYLDCINDAVWAFQHSVLPLCGWLVAPAGQARCSYAEPGSVVGGQHWGFVFHLVQGTVVGSGQLSVVMVRREELFPDPSGALLAAGWWGWLLSASTGAGRWLCQGRMGAWDWPGWAGCFLGVSTC